VTAADPAAKGPAARIAAWVRHHVPTRESVEANRWLRPVAHHVLAPSLWRFNRRSVPRGVALGLATSTLLIPGLWWAAYRIGHSILHLDRQVGHDIASNVKANAGWLHWLFAQAGPATIVGLVVIAVVLGAGGYAVTALAWRLRVARRWRTRHRRNPG
jgi:uncharacterized protein